MSPIERPRTSPSDTPPGHAFVRFHGTRGSIPSPGPRTIRYGGNTPCVEFRVDDVLVILDAGTGVRTLGNELMASGDPVRATLLLTHFHWDHVQGLPFFGPLHEASSKIDIIAPADRDEYVQDRLGRLMEPIYFPVPFHGIRAECHFTAWQDGPVGVEGVRVRALPMRHPSRTVGYRVDTPGGASFCYLPDNELEGGRYDVPRDWRARLERFVGDADVLVHDTMYTAHEIPGFDGWGHSSPEQAVSLARAAGVRRLIGFHHAPDRSDDDLDALADRVREAAGEDGGIFEFAVENEPLVLPPHD